MELPEYPLNPTDKYSKRDIEHFDEYRERYKQFAAGIKDIKTRYASEIYHRKFYSWKCEGYNEFRINCNVFTIYVPPETEWVSFFICDIEVVYNLTPVCSLERILKQARTLPTNKTNTGDFIKVKLMRPIMYRYIGYIRTSSNVDFIMAKCISAEENEYDEEHVENENGEYLGINYTLKKHNPHVAEINKLVEQDTYYFLDQSSNMAGFYYNRKDRSAELHQIYHPDNIIRKLDKQLKLNT
tara:strand:- start:56 stop:778 length:723 start_codon:yes stop_codon:yes gene_type:complete